MLTLLSLALYSKYMNKYKKQEGQVLLVVVLVMVVVLTIALSIAAQNIIHVRTTADEAASQKAFSAAEAGVEKGLASGKSSALPQSFSNNATIQSIAINPVQKNSLALNNGGIVHKDEGIDVWLSNGDTTNGGVLYKNPWSGTLTVYWGTQGNCNDAAVEIIVISGSTNNPVIDHYAADGCPNRRSSNNFKAAGGGSTIDGVAFQHSYQLPAITNGLIARIVPLYSDDKIGVNAAGNPLPAQGNNISAVGTSAQTQRKITLFQGYQSVPTEFFYTLFQTQ